MKKHLLFAVVCGLLVAPLSARAALVVVDTDDTGVSPAAADTIGADDIADVGDTVVTYMVSTTTGGVSFDLSFDLTAIGGFLNGSGIEIGIWSDTFAETGSSQVNVNRDDEGFTLDNVVVDNVSGGAAVFDSVTRVGIRFGTATPDGGTFVIGPNVVWDDLNDGDPHDDDTLNLDGDGGTGETFNLRDAFLAGGGVGPITSFDLTSGPSASSAWRLDAIEFNVITSAIPEPSAISLLAMGLALLGFRFRRLRRQAS